MSTRVPKDQTNYFKLSESETPPMKRRFNRANNGCWTCRRRKVKCDLTKPKCTRCANAGIRCEGFDVKLNWGAPLTLENFNNREGEEDAPVAKSVRRSHIELFRWKKPYLWYRDLDLDLELIELNEGDFRKGPFGKWCWVSKKDSIKSFKPILQGHVDVNVNLSRSTIVDTATNGSPSTVSGISTDRLALITRHIPDINHYFKYQKHIISLDLLPTSLRNQIITEFILNQPIPEYSEPFMILLSIILISMISKCSLNRLEKDTDFKIMTTYLNTQVPQISQETEQSSSSYKETLLTLLIILSKSKRAVLPFRPLLLTYSQQSCNTYTVYTHLVLLHYLQNPTQYHITNTNIPFSSKYQTLFADYLDPQYNLLTNVKKVITGRVYDEGTRESMLNNGYERIDINLKGKKGDAKVGEEGYKPRFSIDFVNGGISLNKDDNLPVTQTLEENRHDTTIVRPSDIFAHIKELTNVKSRGLFNIHPKLLLIFLELSQLVLQNRYFQGNKYINLGHARNFPQVCKELLQVLRDSEIGEPSRDNNDNGDDDQWRDYRFYQFLIFWYYKCIERYPLQMLKWHIKEAMVIASELNFVRELMNGVGVKFDNEEPSKIDLVDGVDCVWRI